MRARWIRRLAPLALSAAVVSTLLAPAAVGGPRAAAPRSVTVARAPAAGAETEPVPAEVFNAALAAAGTVVRADAKVKVERVDVPSDLRERHPGVPARVLKVTVTGTFPPRALRYLVLVDGRPIGYGVPSGDGSTLVTVTTEARALTGRITTRYGDRDVPASTSAARPSPAPTRGQGGDPGILGPLLVSRRTYHLGAQVYQPPGLGAKVDLVGDVHFPTDLSDGPYPLVLFMHGNHYTCYRGERADYRWPCRRGWKALPNFAGYDYLASRLASWGFIVVSVSANGVNYFGNAVDDTGMRQRGFVMEKHIDLWRDWSTVGGPPFGDLFLGTVDLSRIGTMGHSRGGEGVVWNVIVDRQRREPYGIDAVLALAPVDFTRRTITQVPFDVILPTCDGDVFDLQGMHFFDDSRYAVPHDQSPKSTVTVYGANHNFFNTVWSPSSGFPGSFDDGAWTNCARRLAEGAQRATGRAYIVSFFRRYVGGDLSLDPTWTGATRPIVPARTLLSFHAPADDRIDVDRFDDPGDLDSAEAGPVDARHLSRFTWCPDLWDMPCIPGDNFQYLDVHQSWPDWLTGQVLPGLGQGVIGWTEPGGTVSFTAEGGGLDVSGFDAFQFRAAVNPGYQVNDAVSFQDLTVALVDGNGVRSEVVASDVGNDALAYPSDDKFILNMVRFPLSAFSGVDLSDIDQVELVFSQVPSGVIDVSDVAFSRGAA